MMSVHELSIQMTIHGNLKERGELIGANDLLIAVHVRNLGLTLITNNTQEFSGVAGLALGRKFHEEQ